MVSLSRRRAPRTAFVLSGGGNLGALQVGMLRALAEHDIQADVVLGCSVGALNGAAYARAPTRAGVQRIERVWADIDSPTLMPSSRIPSAVQLLRRGSSLHGNQGLRGSLESMMGDQRTFEQLALPFQCVATEVDTAMERWFDEGDLIPAILASAALPAVYPPVEIGGRRYVDGGVIDNVPISRAVDLGCDRIFVLHVGPHGRPDAELRRPIDGALLAYWLARNSRFARDLAALPDGTEAIVLPPGARPELRYDDFGQTASLIEQGYLNTDAFLTTRAEELEQRRRESTLKARLSRFNLRSPRSITHAQRTAVDPGGGIVTGESDAEDRRHPDTGFDDTRSDDERPDGAAPGDGSGNAGPGADDPSAIGADASTGAAGA